MPPLDKPESLFTIAGYSFVAFFLPANVDSFCRRFNLQSSMATFVASTRSYPCLLSYPTNEFANGELFRGNVTITRRASFLTETAYSIVLLQD